MTMAGHAALGFFLLLSYVGSAFAQANVRWEASSFPGEAGKSVIGCAAEYSDDAWVCLVVRCEAASEWRIYLETTDVNFRHAFTLNIDGKRFAVEGRDGKPASPYAYAVSGDTAAIVMALRTGKAVVVEHPGFKLNAGFEKIALRDAGKAIYTLENACRQRTEKAAAALPKSADAGGAKPVTQLNGLNRSSDCAFARSKGKVAEIRTAGDGSIDGFWFNDQWGRSYINVDRQADAAKRDGLRLLLRTGNELEIGVHGCGAAGKIEKLVDVKLLKAGAGN